MEYVLVLISVVLLTGVMIFLIKNFSIHPNEIAIAKDIYVSILHLSKSTFKTLGVDEYKVDMFAEFILEALEHMKILSGDNQQEKIDSGMAMIKEVAREFDIEINSKEEEIILGVLEAVYTFYMGRI